MKKYILVVLLIIAITLTVLPMAVMAAPPVEGIPDGAELPEDLPEEAKYIVLWDNSLSKYVLYYFANSAGTEWGEFRIELTAGAGRDMLVAYTSMDDRRGYRSYSLDCKSWSEIELFHNGYSMTIDLEEELDVLIASNYDVRNTGGGVFFSKTPFPEPLTLTLALRQVDSLTPVKNRLLGGVGSLIPLLIGLIVGAVALRKAWVFLKTGLTRA